MLITGGDTAAPGTALLIAAAPVGRGRLIDAGSVLPALAAVPPSALTGTRAATVVELADPLDPQTVLTRIRAAATAEGPLFLYVAGQLQLDRKQRLPHLALARSTPSTLRYTALPWHWLASELAIRRPGTTTLVVDLVAGPEAWRRVTGDGLGIGPAVRLYGRVAPAGDGRETAVPAYLRACAAIWRSGARPDPATLHERAAAEAGADGALLLTPSWSPGPGTPSVPGVPVGGGPMPVPLPGAVGPLPTGYAPDPALGAPPPGTGDPVPGSAEPPTGPVPFPAPVPVPADSAPVPAGFAPVPAGSAPAPVPVPAPDGNPDAHGSPAPTIGPPRGATPGPPAARPTPAPVPWTGDPHASILAAARDGRHDEAAAAAAEREREETSAHGPGSLQA
ncbi:hypothetical protein, partial [Streptomyces sp. NPDC004726]